MSTNYYIHEPPQPPSESWVQAGHVGKSYASPTGRRFIWAMEPGALEGALTLENEYGDVLSRTEFMEFLQGCEEQEFHSIGVEFS